MLKTIKKIALLSLFTYSFILPMRQVTQAALTSVLQNKQVAQILVARRLEQSVSLHNSLIARFPFVDVLQMVEQVADVQATVEACQEINTQTTMMADQTVETQAIPMVDESAPINVPDTLNAHLVGYGIINKDRAEGCIKLFPESNTDEAMNKNSSSGIGRSSESVSTNRQFLSSSQMAKNRHNFNASQAQQHLSEIADRYKVQLQQEAYSVNLKSHVSSGITNFGTNVQNETSKLIISLSSLSHSQVIAKKADLFKRLGELENQLLNLNSKSDNEIVSAIFSAKKEDFYFDGSPFHSKESLIIHHTKRCTIKECEQVLQALELKTQIEGISLALEEFDRRIYQFEQKGREFVSELEKASVDQIAKRIIDLKAEQEPFNILIAQKKNELNNQNNEVKRILAKLKSTNKWSIELENARIKQAQLSKELQSLYSKQKEYNPWIEHAQKVFNQKTQIQLQQVQLLKEKQEQETFALHHEMVKNKYNSYNFDSTDCPAPELESQWHQRQEALSETIKQGYAQYNQQYNFHPQTAAFLAAHGIDYKEFQSFCGTALQQQLHSEICDVFSQAAKLQASLSYRSNLLTSVVDFADAAHDANKNEQILLASRLLDVDSYLLNLNSHLIDDIVHNPIAYTQAGLYGVCDGLETTAHMVRHPIETIQGLGKALYYVLETAALNSSQVVTEYPEVFESKRDARNAEIIAALEDLGEKFQKATGPEKFRALVGFGIDFKLSGKIIHIVGDVCGFVKEQAQVKRTIEGVATIAQEQGVAQEFIQAAEKMEAAAQEAIAKNLATELMDAKQNIAIYNRDGSLLKRCKILPKTEVIDRLAKCGWKISKEDPVLYNNVDYYLKQANAKMPKIEDALLKEYKKITQIVGNPELSLCMDIEHTVTAKYELVLDSSETFYKVELKGGHLAGTMDNLVQEKLVEIKDFIEFGNGCKEYKIKDLLNGSEFIHTEFPPHWNAEKIAQETIRLTENAIKNGSLNKDKHVTSIMTKDGFELKIVTNPKPEVHACESIENTVNRHIITARPDKG